MEQMLVKSTIFGRSVFSPPSRSDLPASYFETYIIRFDLTLK